MERGEADRVRQADGVVQGLEGRLHVAPVDLQGALRVPDADGLERVTRLVRQRQGPVERLGGGMEVVRQLGAHAHRRVGGGQGPGVAGGRCELQGALCRPHALGHVAAVGVRRCDPGVEQRLLGRVLARQLGTGVDRERLVVGAPQSVDQAQAPGGLRIEPLAAPRRARERRGRGTPVAADHERLAARPLEPRRAGLLGQQRRRLGHLARGPADHEHRAVPVEERRQRGLVTGGVEVGERLLEPVVGLEPGRRAQVEPADRGRLQRQARPGVLADQPVEDVPARVTGERLEEQGAPGQPLQNPGGARDPARLEQRAGEPLEVDGVGEGPADGLGRRRDDLLGEVREQRTLGTLQPVQDRLPATGRCGEQRLDREAHRGRPAARGGVDSGGGVAHGFAGHDVGVEQVRDQRLDLGHGERER